MLPAEFTQFTQFAAGSTNPAPPVTAAGLGAEPDSVLIAALTTMTPTHAAELIPRLRMDRHAAVFSGLPAENLAPVIDRLSADQLRASFAELGTSHYRGLAAKLGHETIALLLEQLLPFQGDTLLAETPPARARAAVAYRYERAVTRVLGRAKVHLSTPDDAPAGVWLVTGPRWRIVAAIRHGDTRHLGTQDAEEVAGRLRADAAMYVTDCPLDDHLIRYAEQARRAGRNLEAVQWTDSRDDSRLLRSLAALLG